MAADLHAHRVTALAITPGFLRSEAVLAAFGVTEANWRNGIETDPYFAESETPCFVGRARGGARRRPARCEQERRPVVELGAGEGVRLTDLDGRRPDWGTFFARKVQEIVQRNTPPTRWTCSWSAPASTKLNSTRPRPKKPPACAPGSTGSRDPRGVQGSSAAADDST